MKTLLALLAVAATSLAALPVLAGPIEDADALRKKGKKAEAVTLLEKAAEAAPKDCALSRALGEAYFDAGDSDMGAMTCERFVKECPKDPAASAIAKKLEQHYEAKSAYRPGPASKPVEEDTGKLYLVPLPPAKERGGGTEDDRWAVENDSRFKLFTAVEEALEHMRATRFAEAVAVLETHLKKNPGDEQAWRFLGTARAQLGDKAGAVKAYEKYLSLAPKAPDADPIRKSLKYGKK